MRQRVPDQVEHGLDVHAEGAVDARGIDLLELLHRLALEGRVVHQHVDAPERAHRFVHHPAAVLFLCEIAGDQECAATRRFDHALGLVRVLVLVQVRDDDIGAFTCERERHGAADPAVGAGDHGDAPLQAAEPAVGFLAVIRSGRHVPLASRVRLLLLRERRLLPLVLRILRHGASSCGKR